MPREGVGVRTVKAIYAAFAAGDVEAALPHISKTIKFAPRATAELVGRREPTYYGHQGVRQYFADAARAWDELQLHADAIDDRGSEIVVHGHVRGSVGGEPFERRVVWVWQVRDGVAVAMRVSDVD